jgi:hypothetical protein
MPWHTPKSYRRSAFTILLRIGVPPCVRRFAAHFVLHASARRILRLALLRCSKVRQRPSHYFLPTFLPWDVWSFLGKITTFHHNHITNYVKMSLFFPENSTHPTAAASSASEPRRREAAEAWRPELGAAEPWSAELGASEARSAEASANAARNGEHRANAGRNAEHPHN